LYVDQSLVLRGERLGLVVLGFGDDVMQVLNSPGFIPQFLLAPGLTGIDAIIQLPGILDAAIIADCQEP
jgi:hypothetical protein